MIYLSGMKPVIAVPQAELTGKDVLRVKLQNLGRTKEVEDVIEYIPKSKKTTEVIRILRENGIEYQIRFEASAI